MRGFTLVEVLVSALILGLLISGIYGVLNVGNMTYLTDMGLLDLQQQTRQVMDGMTREIRQSGRSTPYSMTINTDGSLTFSIPSISNITYSLNNSHQIIRQQGGTNKVLANDVNSLIFCWWNGTSCCTTNCGSLQVLQISINAAKTVMRRPLTFSLTEQVRLRN